MGSSEAINSMIALKEAPPRDNGELIFDAPWQGRAFGMAVALQEKGEFPWSDFVDRLVTAIAEGERVGEAYYGSWVKALDALLVAMEVIDSVELEKRTSEYLSGVRDEVF